MKEEEILKSELEHVEEDFAEIIMKIPLREGPPREPSPYWLHLEIVERYRVLLNAHIERGTTLLEVGSGPFGITTVALAYMVGSNGCVCAVDKGRWWGFDETLRAATLRERVLPVMCDATQLPFTCTFDMAVSIHALRSFRDEPTIVKILKEMLRVSSRIFVAASLPTVKTKAQRAHIEMYNLKEEIFEGLSGEKNDIHYFPLKKLGEFIERAGGTPTEVKTVDVNLPHYLAFIPREMVEKIEDNEKRDDLLKRWEKAYDNLKKYGEEHPPVGFLEAVRK